MKKQVCIPFYTGGDCFDHAFLVSGQLIESMLIGADLLQNCGSVVNFKTNCLIMYEIEGNMKECKFANKVETELEPQESTGRGFPETADYGVTQSLHEE
jgi:hypothetical protein